MQTTQSTPNPLQDPALLNALLGNHYGSFVSVGRELSVPAHVVRYWTNKHQIDCKPFKEGKPAQQFIPKKSWAASGRAPTIIYHYPPVVDPVDFGPLVALEYYARHHKLPIGSLHQLLMGGRIQGVVRIRKSHSADFYNVLPLNAGVNPPGSAPLFYGLLPDFVLASHALLGFNAAVEVDELAAEGVIETIPGCNKRWVREADIPTILDRAEQRKKTQEQSNRGEDRLSGLEKLKLTPQNLLENLAYLPAYHQSIIRQWYGLEGAPFLTLQAIADEQGLTRERIRQIVLGYTRFLARSSRENPPSALVGDRANSPYRLLAKRQRSHSSRRDMLACFKDEVDRSYSNPAFSHTPQDVALYLSVRLTPVAKIIREWGSCDLTTLLEGQQTKCRAKLGEAGLILLDLTRDLWGVIQAQDPSQEQLAKHLTLIENAYKDRVNQPGLSPNSLSLLVTLVDGPFTDSPRDWSLYLCLHIAHLLRLGEQFYQLLS